MANLPQWQPEFYLWLLYTLILIAERILPVPRLSHPFFIFRQLASGMARKVHKAHHSRSQQRISGLMAVITLTSPWLIIAALLLWMSDLDFVLHALILFLCLFSQQAALQFKRIQNALQSGQKQLARELAQRYLSRDTHQLSALGIQKASIEWYSRFVIQGWLATLLWFALAGPLGAIAYRCLYELAQAWPVQRKQWHDFGFAANYLMRSFAWPASFLAYLVLALRQLLGGNILPWRMAPQPYLHVQDGRLWRAFASKLRCALGGPIYLDQVKRQRPRFSYGDEPNLSTMAEAGRLTLKFQLTCWLILSPLFLIGILIH